jgi:hypothetical protein
MKHKPAAGAAGCGKTAITRQDRRSYIATAAARSSLPITATRPWHFDRSRRLRPDDLDGELPGAVLRELFGGAE